MASIRSGMWLASLAAVTVLAGCSPRPKDTAAPATPAAQPPVTIPVPPPVVSRSDLLAAVGKAASAFATGQAMPKDVTDLAGRRFAVRVPFGCFGSRDGAAANYAYDAEKRSLKLTARVETWTEIETIRNLVATPQTEAIEGFWIPRPWITDGACPALRPQPIVLPVPATPEAGAKAAPAKAAPAKAKAATSKTKAEPEPEPTPPPFPQTVGLVSTFEAGASRLHQRGTRPYEVVRKADTAPTTAFRLVFEGRIVEGAGGPVVCRSDDPSLPPTCLVRVEFDRVAIEGATGEMYGEWR